MLAAMDQTVFVQITEAISTIYDPSASNDRRRLANEYIEALKQHPQAALWGYHLAHKNSRQPDHIRHFGLTLVENAVKLKWSGMGDEERGVVRDGIVGLVRDGTMDMDVEKTFVKEKVARLFDEIAKRMWPLNWMDMDVLLRQLYEQSSTHRELVLLIYRSLTEDIFIYDDAFAQLRKKELVTGMMAVTMSASALQELNEQRGADVELAGMPSNIAHSDYELILRIIRANPENEGWIVRWMQAADQLHNEWISLARAAAGGDQQRAQTVERLAVLTLNAVAVNMEWVPGRTIEQARVTYACMTLLLSESEPVRAAAVDCLLVLFSRQPGQLTDDARMNCMLKPLFVDGCLDLLVAAWARAHGQQTLLAPTVMEPGSEPLEEEGYAFVKRLAQTIVALGDVQLLLKKNAITPPNLSKYLELLLVILSHPSLLVASTVAPLWTEILRHAHFQTLPETTYMLPPLRELVASMLCKQGNKARVEAAAYYTDIDFDSKDFYELAENDLHQRLQHIISTAATLEPEQSFLWVARRIQAMLGQHSNEPGYIQLFEGNAELLDHVMRGVRPAQLVTGSTSLTQAMQDLVQVILSYETPSAVLTRIQLKMIVALAEVLSGAPDLLLRCLQKLFTFVTFVMPDEQGFIATGAGIRDETRALRRTACSSLIKLAVAMPEILVTIYGDIGTAVRGLKTGTATLPSEQALLTEFLLAIACSAAALSVEQKEGEFMGLVRPVVDEFQQAVDQMAASPEALVHYSGLGIVLANTQYLQPTDTPSDIPPPLLQELETKRTDRGKLTHLLGALNNFLKRTLETSGKDLAATLWTPLLPALTQSTLTLISTLHGVHSPTTFDALPTSTKPLVRGSHKLTATDGPLLKHLTSILRTLSTLRELSFGILTHLTHLGRVFYTLPDLLTTHFRTAVFETAAGLGDRYWKSTISSVARPVVMHCPADDGDDGWCVDAVLQNVLLPLCEFATARLGGEWRAAEERGLVMGVGGTVEEGGEEDVSEDIDNERVLRDVTRAFAELVTGVIALAPAPTTTTTAKKPDSDSHPPTPFTPYKHPHLVQPLLTQFAGPYLAALLACITYKDTLAARKAVIASMKLVPTLAALGNLGGGTRDLWNWASTPLLTTYLHALRSGYFVPLHSDLFSAVAECYATFRPLCETPAQTLAVVLSPAVPVQKIRDFEAQILATANSKTQNALVRALLGQWVGVAVGELGREDKVGGGGQGFVLDKRPEKAVFERPRVKSERRRGEEEESEDKANGWFGGLFDE
ncbi:armadillo-type protein [Fimicolochytrium jonesii]|uniref:armadillo-type protein n=1 Tax=Fimicolochytrium jonesii TaxID=1396493 RepID=UPI0022FDEC83|nr:armadillo-type protein [Fimicolochytrium jonesii]KAI8816980.1 armadillo-type protein [Fimicolochytrium jonesii]